MTESGKTAAHLESNSSMLILAQPKSSIRAPVSMQFEVPGPTPRDLQYWRLTLPGCTS